MRPLLALPVVLLLAACTPDGPTAPRDSADVEGTVLMLLPDQRALVAATVRAAQHPDTFFVNPGPDVLVRQPDGSVRRGDKHDIRVGDHLKAWLVGIELRSLPPQYPARVVEVRHAAP